MMSKICKELKIATIVIGYDKYNDTWPYFEFFYNKSNIGKHMKTVFVTSEINGPSSYECVTAHSFSASTRILEAIKRVDADYYFLLLEDYLIGDTTTYETIRPYIEFALEEKIDYLCLCNFITKLSGKYYKKIHGMKIGILNAKRNYRISLQPSIWSRKLLLSVISNNIDTLWDFENYLNYNNDYKYVQAFFPYKKKISFINMVDKGEVTIEAYNIIKKYNLPKPERKRINYSTSLKKKIKNKIIGLIPNSILHFLMVRRNAKSKK